MRQKLSLLLALLLGAAALAGCADDADEPTDGTPSTSTPATSTPATSTPATSTPALSTPATTTPATGQPTVDATITRVVVVSAPDRVAPGERAEVCFRVEGTGSVPHVALHYDTVSHPNSTSFTEYAGGAAYPGGGSTSPRVSLPGAFCANLTAPASGALYYRAHALAPPAQPGVLSVEKRLLVGEATDGIAFVGDVPEIAPANANVTICWRAPGATGTVPHTAIHFDTASHPNATSFTEYAGGAVYPDNQTSQSGNYTLPGPFCTNVRAPASGALYYRAHVLGGSFGTPGNLSEERSLVVAPRVNVVGVVPATAAADSDVPVCWRVEGAGASPHVAVHWDTTSHPDATSFSDYAGGAAYAGNGTAAAASQTLPGPFCTTLRMPSSGTLYFRAHGVYPAVGMPGELSDEHAIRVS